MSDPTPEEMWPEVDPPTTDPGGAVGWVDTAAQAETNAKAYADEQIPLVAGRMVPRSMDRAPAVGDGEGLLAGTGWNQYDPATGDLVQMWRWDGTAWQALDMSPEMIPVLDIGSATVGDLTGGRINVQDGPIVAGTPGGARVELTGDGLHAYNAAGTETASIEGGEGVFVGGEFRTSDALPGQVRLADDAFVNPNSGVPGPGISIAPTDPTAMTRIAGVGPFNGGVCIDGGESGAGSSRVDASPGLANVFATSATGAYAFIQARPSALTLRTFRGSGVPRAIMEATADQVRLESPTEPGGRGVIRVRSDSSALSHTVGLAERSLTVDANGIWVKTGGKSYNLEETAQDTGWVNLALSSAHTATGGGAAFQYRRMGNLIHLRGRVGPAGGGQYAASSEYTLAVLPAEIRPAVAQRQIIAGGTQTTWGRVSIDAGTGVLTVASMSGPANWMDLTGISWTLD